MSRTLVRRAQALADLVTLSSEIGAAARVEEDGSVSLIGTADPAPRRIGASVEEAVRQLKTGWGSAQPA